MSVRQNANSAADAAGKPTSISLKPMPTRASNKVRFRAPSMGFTKAWLPSRRSTLHHVGADTIRLVGQSRSGRSMPGYARYFVAGDMVTASDVMLGELHKSNSLRCD